MRVEHRAKKSKIQNPKSVPTNFSSSKPSQPPPRFCSIVHTRSNRSLLRSTVNTCRGYTEPSPTIAAAAVTAAMPKKTTTSARGERRHNPLHEELVEDESAGVRKVARQKRRDRDERDNDGAGYYEISAAAQRMAAEQQDEVAAEARPRPALGSGFDAMAARFDAEEDDDEEEDGAGYDDEWEDEGVEEIEEVVEVDEADAALFERFCGSGGGAGAGGDDSDGEGPEQRPSLADIILAKISEHEARAAAAGSSGGRGALADGGQQQAQALPPKVIEVYTQVGLLLSRYKSGRLPKAFKIIPTLRNWEEILYLTRPDKWTPHATFEATKIFAAQNSNQAQRCVSLGGEERGQVYGACRLM